MVRVEREIGIEIDTNKQTNNRTNKQNKQGKKKHTDSIIEYMYGVPINHKIIGCSTESISQF